MKLFKLDSDTYVSIYLCLILSFVSINLSINELCNNLISNNFIGDTIIIYLAYFFFLICALVKNKFRITYESFALLIFVFVYSAISTLITPQTSYYINGFFSSDFLSRPFNAFIIFALMGFIVSTYIKKTDVLFAYMEKFSYLIVVLQGLQYLLRWKLNNLEEYMTFSYTILFSTAYLTNLCIYKFKIQRLIFSLIGAVLLVVVGCRGALLSYMACVGIYILSIPMFSSLKKITLSIFIISIVLAIYSNFNEIIYSLNDFLTGININSRALIKITESDFFLSTGRDVIRQELISNFNLFGHGFYSDRIAATNYAHNLIIEFIYDFGEIGGTFLLGILALTLIRALIKATDIEKVIIISLMSAGIFKLMFSSSFLNQEPHFYVMLGLCTVIIKRNNSSKEKNTKCVNQDKIRYKI